ncbi:globin [Zooshikella marina]|uniref:Globin n=2 Tax=Zooshikella ganghwensis TaxID=202772 RepID=A0A4P9VWL3_9GAMM|nr:globin [Zooshikella ganghwensis]MBU2707142.1 globin [Zooshikella ganghwensis]RDH46812.1 globin [Zooshikella ganghwensis]
MSEYERIFDESYERVRKIRRNQQTFFEAFYEHFMATSPEIAARFVNTEMSHQRRMLEKSFYKLLTFYATNNAADYLEKIAQLHDHKHLNIKPVWYDLWLEALMATLRKFDPDYSDEIELAWRLVLSPGITFMKYRYNHTFTET